MADEHILIKKFGKDPDPDKLSPMKEWEFRNNYTDQVTNRAIAGVRKRQNRARWTFGMPKVSDERWNEIFPKGKK
uniref:Uncharacterized protein n=1 Tax=viral metagenome TaxID=1070528 RepID=A0A6M3KJ07_9ZZZZ